MKDKNQLDELFRKNLQNRNFEPEEGDWEKAWALIEKSPAKNVRPWAYFKWFTFSFLSISCLAGLWWIFSQDSTQNHHSKNIISDHSKISDQKSFENKDVQKAKNYQDIIHGNNFEQAENKHFEQKSEKKSEQKSEKNHLSENILNQSINDQQVLKQLSHSKIHQNPVKKPVQSVYIAENKQNNNQIGYKNNASLLSQTKKLENKETKKSKDLLQDQLILKQKKTMDWLAVQLESDMFGAIVKNPFIEVKSSIQSVLPLQVDTIQTKLMPYKQDTSDLQAIKDSVRHYFQGKKKFHFSVSGGLLAESSGRLHEINQTSENNISTTNSFRNQAKTGIFIEPEIRFKGISLTSGVNLWSMPQKHFKETVTNTEAYILTTYTTVIDTGYYVQMDSAWVWIPIKQTVTYTTVDTIPLQFQKKEEAVDQVRYIEIPLLAGFQMRKNRLDLGIKAGLSWSKPVRSKGSDLIITQLANSHYSLISRVRIGYFLTEFLSIYAEPNIRYTFSQKKIKSDFYSGLRVGCSLLF